jgi:membrane protease YdiL (CAAX protease family)
VETSRNARAEWGLRDVIYGSLVAGFAFGLAILGIVVAGLLVLQPADLESYLTTIAPVLGLAEWAMVLPAWWFGPRKYGSSLATLGFRPVPWGRMLAMAGVGLAVAFGFAFVWSLINAYLGWPTQPDVGFVFGRSIWGFLAALVVAGFVAPVAEEVFFRGFLQAGLENRFGTWMAILLTALVFAVIHVFPGALPPIFVLGIIFGVLRAETNSVWPCILLHGASNALSVIAAYAMEVLPQIETAWQTLLRLV